MQMAKEESALMERCIENESALREGCIMRESEVRIEIIRGAGGEEKMGGESQKMGDVAAGLFSEDAGFGGVDGGEVVKFLQEMGGYWDGNSHILFADRQ